MRFAFSEEQQGLRKTARAFLDVASSPERVRKAMATTAGYDVEVWQRICGELGWPALIIPEAYGGFGFSHVELAAVMEEVGRSLLCAPLFSTVCLAANALLAAGTEAQKQAHLPGIASGEVTATLALTEARGGWTPSGIEATATRVGGDYELRGTKTFVIDGHTADILLVAARAEGSRGAEGVSLFVVRSDAPGLTRTPLGTMDQTRKQAEVRLDGVRVPAAARLGAEGEGWAAIRATLDRAAVALSAEQLGGAERCLDMAVEYAKVRVQFNRPIGSFQAIKHKLADVLVLVESARSASYYAAWAAAEEPSELPAAASIAKAYGSEAFFRAASENIQVHGGIGFTWEHDAHLYFKRARASEALLGDPAFHRERIAAALEL